MWLCKNERERKVCPKYTINKTEGKQWGEKSYLQEKQVYVQEKSVTNQ